MDIAEVAAVAVAGGGGGREISAEWKKDVDF